MFKRIVIGVAFCVSIITACSAQQYMDNVYQLNYYTSRNNAAGADQKVRIVNPGTQGTPIQKEQGIICADIYVFDATQEMIECCHCSLTANELLDLSILRHLTQSPLTGFPAPDSGVIKIVSDSRQNCNETSPVPTLELLAWASHVQEPVPGTFVTTEDAFRFAPLDVSPNGELSFLGLACSFVQYLGSGKGICKCSG
jgi:hypothetical protein